MNTPKPTEKVFFFCSANNDIVHFSQIHTTHKFLHRTYDDLSVSHEKRYCK